MYTIRTLKWYKYDLGGSCGWDSDIELHDEGGDFDS